MFRDPRGAIAFLFVSVCYVSVCPTEAKVLPTDLKNFVQAAGYIADQGSHWLLASSCSDFKQGGCFSGATVSKETQQS